jgi:hypothetical protein
MIIGENQASEFRFGTFWLLAFAWQHVCSDSDQHKDISGHERDCSAHWLSLFPWPDSSRFFFLHMDMEIKRSLIWYDQWHSEDHNGRTECWHSRQFSKSFQSLYEWML